jgi:pyrophosphatase PpaX
MNSEITTLLFDLDGTLINTNELIIASFSHTLEHYYPGQYTREDILPFMGPTLEETFGSINPDRMDEMIARYRQHNWEHHDLLVTQFDGVYETIESLAQSNYRLGVVTTKRRDVAERGLKLTNLDKFFEVVVTLEDAAKTKPDPEPILKALSRFNAEATEAMMIGDNYHDIMGGRNAGTLTAGVAWSLKGREVLQSYKPDYMLERMSDLIDILQGKQI